ncbi:MAG TPA: hypothetical protein VFC78_05880, partial [Tepidisphaeraceae bacterium]|nr:hypothetical protein [Tepidisphaeraceae bacterium]
MRSFVLVTLACLVLGGAFFVYTWMQPKNMAGATGGALSTDPAPPSPATRSTGMGAMGPGSGAWVLDFDQQTGQLKSRFRSDEYLPQSNGIVKVTGPEAEFFMPNHQKMRIVGLTGEVVVPGTTENSKGSLDQAPAAPPSRGRIHTVTIEIYNLQPDSNPAVPDEVIHTDNVQFDNETLLITTESFTDSAGKIVAPDQVPVHMRSTSPTRGYDMDGWGLRLRWNEKDGRLELLEIAHGESLTIKDTSSVSGTFGGAKRLARTPPAPGTPTQTSALSLSASAYRGTGVPPVGLRYSSIVSGSVLPLPVCRG